MSPSVELLAVSIVVPAWLLAAAIANKLAITLSQIEETSIHACACAEQTDLRLHHCCKHHRICPTLSSSDPLLGCYDMFIGQLNTMSDNLN